MNNLQRRLGLFSATAILIGTTIGSGIFRSPAGIAAKIPDTAWFFAAWIIGGLCVLAGALTYAELAGALPHTGGTYVYLREAYGELPAFLFGWANLTIIRAAALGAISTVFAEYMLRMFGIADADAVHYGAALTILFVAALNFAGIQSAAAVQNLTTCAKYAALAVLVVASFVMRGAGAPSSSIVATAGGSTSVGLFGLALISILWVYDGWADLTFVSGEVRKPEKYLPLSLMIGTLSVIVIYLAANAAYIHMFDIRQIAQSKLVAADVAQLLVGKIGVTFISLTVMVSTFGTVNGSLMTGSRIFFAMADDGLFFKKIAAVHPRFNSPHVAIWLTAALGVVFVMLRNFEQLADAFVLAMWPFYAAGTAAVYVLRRKRPELSRPYRVWGYPVTPAVFLAGAVFLLGNALITDFANVWFVFAILLSGIPAFWIWQAFSHREKAARIQARG